MHYLRALWSFLVAWWPWIAGTLLPSILVALTKSPTPGSNKIANAIKFILQLGSVLTHKDETGTLKPPLVTSAAAARLTGGSTGAPTAAVLLALMSVWMAIPIGA